MEFPGKEVYLGKQGLGDLQMTINLKTKGNNHAPEITERTLLDNTELKDLQRDMDNLFEEDTLSEMLQPVKHNTKPVRGNKGKTKGRRYKTGRMRDILDQTEGKRVVPMYDGFDPINGGVELLTPWEHRFAIVYARTGNATKAAEVASIQSGIKGTNAGTFRKRGHDALNRHHVAAAIGMMQKKICVAAALDSTEVIANIREIAALAMVDGKYDAALKANIQLGEMLGLFGKTKDERMKTVSGGANQVIEVFKTGEELLDSENDIKKLTSSLGLIN